MSDDLQYTHADRPTPDCVCAQCGGAVRHGDAIVWRESDDTIWHNHCFADLAGERVGYRLPRKGDRVRFWVVESPYGRRYQQTGTVLRRRSPYLYLTIDGLGDREMVTSAREMEIL